MPKKAKAAGEYYVPPVPVGIDPATAVYGVVTPYVTPFKERQPDPEAQQWVMECLAAILFQPRHPARKYFRLPTRRGAPRQEQRDMLIVQYVALALDYGHSKNEALDLAAKEFGFRGSREKRRDRVRSICKGVPVCDHKASRRPRISQESFAWTLTNAGITPPPKKSPE